MKTTIPTTLCAILLLLVAIHGQATKKLFPDTTVGFHWFLVFDTPILNNYMATNATINAAPYDLVWGASDRIIPMYRKTNEDIVLSLYVPWSRDNDGTQNITYWNATHPDWVLYKCDRVTPATQFTDPHIPLDISNPDVIDWQLSKYIGMVRQFGYDGLAADNFAIGNALNACGIWREGEWVQKYTGLWDDPVYNADALNWIKTFYSKLTQMAPDISFGINFSLSGMDPSDPRIPEVIDNLDYVMDEAGFTGWGYGYPTPAVWDQISTWIENIQTAGKHYFGINEFPVLTPEAIEYGMASYLLSKNQASSMVATIIQGYGSETILPQYDALNIGQPLAKRNNTNNIWMRQYSNGLVLANLYNDSVTLTLPNDGWSYRDVLNNTYPAGSSVTIKGQSGMVLGATAHPATLTLTTASTTTTHISTTTTAHITTGGFSTTGMSSSSSTTFGQSSTTHGSSEHEDSSEDGHDSTSTTGHVFEDPTTQSPTSSTTHSSPQPGESGEEDPSTSGASSLYCYSFTSISGFVLALLFLLR